MTFDIDHYLARIGWTGPREPTLETLAGVLRRHMSAIPFENLDVLLGRRIRLDLDSVFAKLVEAGRGGYCFEHGTLFHAAIESLGFQPTPHTARVVMGRSRAEAPLTHMFLTLQIGGETYALDPGFGGHAPLVPVPLGTGQETGHGGESHRMVRRGGDWVLEARIDGTMTALWSSSLERAEPVDFVMGSHFVSTFPDSPFLTRLMLRALIPGGSVSVMNRDVTLRLEGREEKSTIADRRALRDLLVAHFGFDLPEVEQLRVPTVEEWK